ncbi:transglycosylase SLT domain-containing protein [Serratia fonticola]|uniref:transglycosylase SLT domain-containing protein n=1 Tax=Serratia fonticola TaxID=47917 RepID=UPI00301DF747
MSEGTSPVITLAIDDDKLRRLEEVSDKFKAAFSVGPGGFTVGEPGPGKRIPGNNNQLQPSKAAPVSADNARQQDKKGNYLPQDGRSEKSGKRNKPTDDAGGKFLSELGKLAKEAKKDFDQVNKTLKQTNSQLGSLFKNTIAWGVKLSLLTGGGWFGYDMFARHAAKQYTTSQGLGMTTGQMQAAKNVYGTRFAGNDAIMNALAKAQSDGTSQEAAALYGLGLNPKDGAAANLPKLYEKAAKIIADMKGTGLSQSALNARGLGFLGFDTQTANQTKANADQLPRLANQYEGTAKSLDMSVGTQRSWQDISTTFENNWGSVINTLSTKLASLNGPIGALSTDLTNDINAFISGPNGTAVFNMIRDGLTNLANWIASPQFKQDLDDFSTKVGTIVKAIGRAIDDIYLWVTDPAKAVTSLGAGTDKKDAAPELVRFGDKYLNGQLPGANPLTNKYTGFYSEEDAHNRYRMPPALKANVQGFVAAMNQQAGLPTGLLPSIAGVESSWNPLAKGKVLVDGQFGAGLFQFLQSTGKRYGLSDADRYDPNKETYAAARYFRDLSQRYHGDLAKMLTSYNGGIVEKDGSLSLRMETVKYLQAILPQVQGGVDQHPHLMQQLAAARRQLATQPQNARVHLQLDLQQAPGSDIGLAVKSQGVRMPGNAFIIPE